MKKNRFIEFFKGKGYYVLLFVGVIAIAAVALIGSQISSNQKNEDQKIVDLNDTDNNNIASGKNDTKPAENNPVTDKVANSKDNSSDVTAAKDKTNKDVAGNDAELEDYSDNSQSSSTGHAQAATKENTDAAETAGSSVKNENTAAISALSFKTDEGLLWPVKGNVIIDYSMDHTTYFATLMQYRCNPAIIIEAEVGAEVKAATDGIITAINENEETGYTVTMNIGDGYTLVYGQLNKNSVKLKVGDSVKEGQVIGTIAKPSDYYCVEGSNLYFEVLKDKKSVNPMLLLREENEKEKSEEKED